MPFTTGRPINGNMTHQEEAGQDQHMEGVHGGGGEGAGEGGVLVQVTSSSTAATPTREFSNLVNHTFKKFIFKKI